VLYSILLIVQNKPKKTFKILNLSDEVVLVFNLDNAFEMELRASSSTPQWRRICGVPHLCSRSLIETILRKISWLHPDTIGSSSTAHRAEGFLSRI
jgi:hypothetical protein